MTPTAEWLSLSLPPRRGEDDSLSKDCSLALLADANTRWSRTDDLQNKISKEAEVFDKAAHGPQALPAGRLLPADEKGFHPGPSETTWRR